MHLRSVLACYAAGNSDSGASVRTITARSAEDLHAFLHLNKNSCPQSDVLML